MIWTEYAVDGMTCDHCASAVSGELKQLAGVSEVSVDVGTGRVSVASDDALSREDVEAAVKEAGYQLVG